MEVLTIQSNLSTLFCAEINRLTSLKRLELIIPVGSDDEVGEVRRRLPPHLSDFTICHGTLHEHTKILTELSNLKSLTKMQLSGYALESLPDVEPTLKSLTVWHCSALRNIPDRFLSGCSESLQDLRIDNCRNLMCLPSTLSTLHCLQKLHIGGCDGIRQLPTISRSAPNYLTNLSYLCISDCRALECLPIGIHKAITLHTLHIHGCPSLCVTKDGIPAKLIHLHITHCGKTKPFIQKVLPTLTSLTLLHLQGFPDISSLDHCLPDSIQSLTVREFPRLKSISGLLPNLKHLTCLEVDDRHLVDKTKWSKKLNPPSWLSILQA